MSQENAILRYLKTGNKLTPLEALKLFGCFRLGARVYGLRKAGHAITTDLIEVHGGKHVAQYSMRKKACPSN